MAMEFALYILGLLCTFGFGILAYQDKVFGIIGVMTGFSFTAFLVGDGAIDISGVAFTASDYQLCLLLSGIFTIIDILIYNHVRHIGKALPETSIGRD
jgi:hypothetical protein